MYIGDDGHGTGRYICGGTGYGEFGHFDISGPVGAASGDGWCFLRMESISWIE